MKREALDICWLVDVNAYSTLPFVLYLITLGVKGFSSMFIGGRTLGFLLSRFTGPRRNPGPYLEKTNWPCLVVGGMAHLNTSQTSLIFKVKYWFCHTPQFSIIRVAQF